MDWRRSCVSFLTMATPTDDELVDLLERQMKAPSRPSRVEERMNAIVRAYQEGREEAHEDAFMVARRFREEELQRRAKMAAPRTPGATPLGGGGYSKNNEVQVTPLVRK